MIINTISSDKAMSRREKNAWLRFYYENDPRMAAGVDAFAHSFRPTSPFLVSCVSELFLFGDIIIDKQQKKLLNIDWIDIGDDGTIYLIPDEDLKNAVFYKTPKNVYDLIPESIRALVLSGQKIPLSANDYVRISISTSHWDGNLVKCDSLGYLAKDCYHALIRRQPNLSYAMYINKQALDAANYAFDKMIDIKNW